MPRERILLVEGRSDERGGVNVPKQPKHGGVVIEGSPRIGVWLMPDNQSSVSWRTSFEP